MSRAGAAGQTKRLIVVGGRLLFFSLQVVEATKVVQSQRLGHAITRLAADGQRALKVVERLQPFADLKIDLADIVKGAGGAAAVAQRLIKLQRLIASVERFLRL